MAATDFRLYVRDAIDTFIVQIKTLQGTGACPEAIKVGPHAKKPDSILLPIGIPGGGSIMGGLLAALINGPAFLSTKLPDSQGG